MTCFRTIAARIALSAGLCLLMVMPLAAVAQESTQGGAPAGTDATAPRPASTATPTSPDTGDFGQKTDGKSIYGEIGYQILSLFAWFTGLGGILLNATVYYTVVKMGDFVNSMGAIIVAWRVLRDVGNILLIFGFIAMGLATILDIQSYNAKKMMVKLIIVAVTVNFSLFAARAIIDVGNVFAYQFYAQMTKQGNGGEGARSVLSLNVDDEGVSNAIMQMIGLQTFYDPTATDNEHLKSLSDNSFVAFIFGSLLFIVAAFVLFALAFMLIARFVILVFLMILSPLGFIGLIVPSLERRAREWWSMLIAQSAIAPILLLLVLISVTLMTSPEIFNHTGGRSLLAVQNLEATSEDWTAAANMIIGFLISMGLLMASLIIAKQAGAFGASFAISASRRITTLALAPVTRPTAAIGRWGAHTVGSGLGNRYDRYMAKNDGKGVVRTLLRFSGADEGVASTFKTVKNAKFDGKSYEDRKKERENRAHEVDKVRKEVRISEIAGSLTLTPDQKDQEIAKILRSMTAKDLEQLTQIKKGVLGLNNGIEQLAANMSPEQFKSLMKSDTLNEHAKDHLRDARYGSIDTDLAAIEAGQQPNATAQQIAEANQARTRLRQWSAQDLAMSGRVGDQRLAENMTQTQFENTLNRDEISVQEKQTLRNARTAALTDATPTAHIINGVPVNSTRGVDMVLRMNRKDLAKQDADILANPAVYTRITDQQMFGQMQLDSNLDVNQRTSIGRHIQRIMNDPNHPQQASMIAYVQGTPGAKAYWNIP